MRRNYEGNQRGMHKISAENVVPELLFVEDGWSYYVYGLATIGKELSDKEIRLEKTKE